MRNRYVLLADLFAFALAACGAFGLRFDWYFFERRAEFLPFVVSAPIVKAVVFYFFGMYRRFWRYATIEDLLAMMIAGSAASVAMTVLIVAGLVSGYVYEFSRSVVAADWVLTLCLCGTVRLSVRLIGESQGKRRAALATGDKRVLIAGAGDAGTMIVREIQRNRHLRMVPVGFVDDDRIKIGKRIYGVPVLAGIGDLADVVKTQRIDEVLIAMPKARGGMLRNIAEACRQAGVNSRIMPGVFELLDGQVSVSRLRQVDITDLLRRTPIAAGADTSHYLRGRTVLVTGAGGSIGHELCRQVAHARPACLVLLGHGENSIFDARTHLREAFAEVRVDAVIADIRDRNRISRVFETLRPAVVFHAAAHKHVPLMEENPEEAISNNVLGTRNVVEAALRAGADRFVLVSSDKAVSPTSLMGASKRVAEALVREAAIRGGRAFSVVRFGNVLGSRGSVVPTFKRMIEKGGPLTLTHPEMKRFFMTIPEAVHLVLQAGGMARGGELFVLKMGEPLLLVQLAEDLIRLSGLTTDDVPIVFTGIRPGEKLEEALWEQDAEVAPTAHPEILQVNEPQTWTRGRLESAVERLATASVQGNRALMHAALEELVPTFAPSAPRTPEPSL